MRVLIINISERIGGAAIAANRLMDALRNNGIQAKMLVRDKQTDNITVISLKKSLWSIWQFVWERIVIWKANHFKQHNLFAVDIANTGTDITTYPEFKEADIIHLHWVNQGMLSLKDLKKILQSGKPIVWTMHDMWPCTGICHHARECDKYHKECHHCPYLYNGGAKKDLSHQTFKKKKELYQLSPITFITCSQWLKERAGQSALLEQHPIVHIPNPIKTNLFTPRNKVEARQKCNLPTDKKLILFGSVKITDKRKGIDYFIESCKILAEKHPELVNNLGVAVYGKESEQLKSLVPFQVYALDYISNEKELVNVYNAVDLYVTPSLEENLPNTIMEAMACGIPCVGFNVGGIPEMIDHLHNGYVADYKSAEDFANGIHWTLSESEYQSLSEEARRKVISSYSESTIAKKYIEVYNKIIGHHD
jgi:glycosyltransferase involved in cell wall biosynthesis